MKMKLRQYSIPCYSVCIFLFCLVFFTSAHPLIIFDTDDWGYITHVRKAIPMIGAWNPTRVFPEILMPTVFAISTHALGAFFEAMRAMSIMTAVLMSFLISVYMSQIAFLVRKVCKLSSGEAILIGILVFVFHFLVLRIGDHNNTYMFWSVNITSVYYYVIPNILCAIIVLWMIINPDVLRVTNRRHRMRSSFFVLLLYLGLLSNLYASIIIGVYAFCSLTISYFYLLKKRRVATYLRANFVLICILVFWATVQILELTGGRASSLSSNESLLQLIATAFNCLSGVRVNKLFALIIACVAILGIAIMLRGRLHPLIVTGVKKLTLISFLSMILCLIYATLVSSKAHPIYIQRPDVLFATFFFCMVIFSLCLGLLVKRFKLVSLALPLLILICVFHTNTAGITFKESNMSNISPFKAQAITDDIVSQLSQMSGKSPEDAVLVVPKSSNDDNWPLAVYATNAFTRSAAVIGINDLPERITILPSIEMNQKYGLPIPKQ